MIVNFLAALTTLLYLVSPAILAIGGWFIIAPVSFNERAIAYGLCSSLFFAGVYTAYGIINNLKLSEAINDKRIQQ